MGHGHRRHVSRLAVDHADDFDAALFPGVVVPVDTFGAVDVGSMIATLVQPQTFEDRQDDLRRQYEYRRRLVNRGAHDPLVYGVPAPTSEDERFIVDGVFDPAANRVDARTLQRETRITASGHGSGGGRRRTKPVAFDDDRALQLVIASHGELVSRSRLPVLEVKGLTVGEIAVLSTRSERFVAALLTAIHLEVRDAGAVPELKPVFVQVGKPTRRFYVGVEPEVHRTFHFRPFRGASRAALINAAHALDRARIERIDAGWVANVA